MERIDKKYAIVYVDRTGESLEFFKNSDGGFSRQMVTDYYKALGFLQWNFYLIIAKESVPADKVSEIENEEHYARKMVVPAAEIDELIETLFPDMREEHGTVDLIKGANWKDAKERSAEHQKAFIKTNDLFALTSVGSWYRDHSLLDSMLEMDRLRARLIREESLRVVFHTHISDEMNLAEKKFKLLMTETN